ncbi:hypothetical protein ABCS02_03910 [Microbacterium sp. X-17]|uniref:hypothetical protein n=1 Tax=Microbacterium sp. X-17 TaxID=3144404 RepID=UPI0031F4BD80
MAAAIAFIGISRQVSVSRDTARADAWWTMFEWASDRAIPSRLDDQPLPTTVTIRTLQRLADEATSSTQEAACAGVIDVLTKDLDSALSEPLQGQDDGAPNERSDSALAALASYVESSRGTPAASEIAEALVYENDVTKALISLSWEDPSVRIYRDPPMGFDNGVDAIAESDGKRVLIQIKRPSSPDRARAMVSRTISALRSRARESDALLIITPYAPPLPQEQEAELRAVVAQWNQPEDNESLRSALIRATTL